MAVDWREMGWFWPKPEQIESATYTCGWCDNSVATDKGFISSAVPGQIEFIKIYLCHHCNLPTIQVGGYQYPGVLPQTSVANVPPSVNALYEEGRRCVRDGSFTGAALCCRKLLMNVAVQEGAPTNLKFVEYVDYLEDNGHLPPNGRKWVEKIREKGNEATHEIPSVSREDAEALIRLSEMLLLFIYAYQDDDDSSNDP